MINIVMLVKNREALTLQAIKSLRSNTAMEYNLTVIDDQSIADAWWILGAFAYDERVSLLRNEHSKGITGQVRNLGVYWADKYFGRGEWLYLADNDTAFTPGWDKAMLRTMERAEQSGCVVLGGCRHPYHQPNAKHIGWVETDAVAGYSQLMRWDTWDKFGPLDAHAVGICQSEDWAFCQKAVKAGYKVGYITPSAVAHCGITSWDGKPAIGAEHFERLSGFIYE